jgi:hypothetical protein
MVTVEASDKRNGDLEECRQLNAFEERLRHAAAGATAKLKRPRIRPLIRTFFKLLRGTDLSQRPKPQSF